jgi:hypothetical protein
MSATSETIPVADVMAVARELFTEAYEGPTPQGSWFVSARQDAGLFDTVGRVTARRASRPSRPGGPSIAAHVEHLRWSLERVNATVAGAPWQPDWSESWSVSEVDDAAWDELRSALRREFDQLRATLEGTPDVSDPMILRGLVALAPHAAYHLGAVRLLAAQQEA